MTEFVATVIFVEITNYVAAHLFELAVTLSSCVRVCVLTFRVFLIVCFVIVYK